MEFLPTDIKLHILSFSYRPQPNDLLDDIKSYNSINRANVYYYQFWIVNFEEPMWEDRNWLINDLTIFLNDGFNQFNSNQEYYKRFRRLFRLKYHSDDELDRFFDNLWYYPINYQINTVWGLMTVNERIQFLKQYTC
jgi:hypothetical protein